MSSVVAPCHVHVEPIMRDRTSACDTHHRAVWGARARAGRGVSRAEFITGMSPACVDDTEYDCLSLSDIHSWGTVAIWANQSIIKVC